ncbi:MAG: sulfite exporter TauE/SafE family protein [Desulfarculaceae bacterium]|nr:sulfite exporter TauE/SafE family protein [Desulfarculaceae bacterium]MCF8048965.1 sulfite exporter TauE/SafE family protein [Desulfarculaceae bacterium]MCF8065246.1 sulfite exporter TauE/SafE family protein [Desulfarculaceae bacterium]MCF8099064.1 sulfite exporter TauE/SafE family protein [Desulfarculaceae bacterium]
MRKLWLATLSILILGLMTAVATTGSLAQKTAVAPAGQEQAVMVSKDMPAKLQKAIKQSLADAKFADKTQKALAQGVAKRGQTPGFLGIPGAPAAHYVWGLLWAIWVGWIFSTVGAFGGIMAGVGHITIFGLADYAKSFGKGNPVNKLLTDSIRVSNQWLVGLSALISSFNYYKMGRLVLPLGACLAIGGVAGSWMIPELTAGKVSLKDYIGYFGLIVFVLGLFLIYEMTPRGQRGKKAAKAAAAAFEKSTKEGDSSEKGVKIISGSQGLMWLALGCVVASALWFNLVGSVIVVAYILALVGLVITFFMGSISFTFFGVEFKFKAFIPMLGGLVIASIASFLGIGGGFLFVPFLTSVAGLPMFLVAGTSALVVLVGMVVSIFSYMVGKAVPVSWGLIGAELIGIFIGSMIGPRTSKYIPEKGLKWMFIILAFYVGLRYTTKGFLGYSIVPPF